MRPDIAARIESYIEESGLDALKRARQQAIDARGGEVSVNDADLEEPTPKVLPLPLGAEVGRWRIVRRAAPEPMAGRRGKLRRVVVECVCGVESITFERYLKLGRTLGCPSKSCRITWERSQGMLEHLGLDTVRSICRRARETGISIDRMMR